MVINTAVAESLRKYADELETAKDLPLALHELIKSVIHAHKRIIFNGNGYDDAWVAEAEKRGLLNLRTTTDCLPSLIAQKNIELFSTHRVLSETELRARYEIMTENYKKIVCIEAMTMLDMARRDILPASSAFQGKLAGTIAAKRSAGSMADSTYETETLETAAALTKAAYETVKALEDALSDTKATEEVREAALPVRTVCCPRERTARKRGRTGNPYRHERLAVSELRRTALWCSITAAGGKLNVFYHGLPRQADSAGYACRRILQNNRAGA